jgi:hypothetical protein
MYIFENRFVFKRPTVDFLLKAAHDEISFRAGVDVPGEGKYVPSIIIPLQTF